MEWFLELMRIGVLEVIMEVVFGTILEGILELWTNFMKKRNSDYDNSSSKKVFTKIIGAILVIVGMIIIIVVLSIIEWLYPNLFDMVSFD